ncbi:MAG TPA: hypothetical protein VK588_01840 [Chitinophagaceae bacterium]|nr:hypothetical protein [Chitinophagaceae bacterium]
MKLVEKILHKLNGLHYKQEYLCLSKETFEHPLHAYLVVNNRVVKDITELHLFVGYNPLILAIPSSGISNRGLQIIDIAFSQTLFQPNEYLAEKEAIALLSMKKIREIKVDEDTILFYEGIKGTHHFLSGFHQTIIQLNNRLHNKKQGNVFLENNLYKQVQIAYAIPRKICLVTVWDNNLYNHFPTDLHGRINNWYVVSLRHEGKACHQVQSARKIVLSDINSKAYKEVYKLGKNHMQPPKDRSFFDFNSIFSKNFNLPLAKDVLSYKELELENSFINGIHKLLLFRVVFEEKISSEPATLAHIHNCYATWRFKHRISSNYLLR